MGGKSSKGTRPRISSSFGSSSSSWSNQGYPQSPYSQSNQHYTPQHNYASPQSYVDPSKNYSPQNGRPQRKLERKYSKITDDYNSLEQVTAALSHAGLESSNLIVGIDFTKSNEWTGARSFNRRSLHHISDTQNPYEQAISIIGRTLSKFDEDNLIPCFGFGDASTHDQNVFSFFPDERPCDGFEEALIRYREIVPHLKLAGPTSFAPVIEMAMTIVDQSEGQYHVLLIIADGQVTRSVDTDNRHLSPQEQKTVDAIVKASRYPLSIILVGVGDGPWDMMREFDDNIPARAFDNFQFVNFTEIMSKNMPLEKKETEFALSALMEIPSQYKATLELHILGCASNGRSVERVPLPTPIYGAGSFNTRNPPSRASSFQHRASPYDGYETSTGHQYYDHETTRGTASPAINKKQPPSRSSSSPYNGYESTSTPYSDYQTSTGTAPHASSNFDNKVCPICLTDEKDMAFGCGHQTCCGCGEDLDLCPICRSSIQTRIKLY